MGDQKNKRSKKVLSGILSWGVPALLGFFSAFLSADVIREADMSVIAIVTICICVYFISVAIHELSHFIGFIYNKVPMRMISIFFITFLYDGEKWRLKFNNSPLIGGIAIPNLPYIKNKSDFDKVRKAYINAIIAAPIVTIILSIIGTVIAIISSYNHPYVLVTGAVIAILNLVLAISCFSKTEQVYGDFRAYSVFKNDDFFVVLSLYGYLGYSVDYEKTINNSLYLRELLIKGFKERVEEKKVDMFTASCASAFIIEFLTGELEGLPREVTDYIDYLYDNQEILSSKTSTESHKQLLLYMAYYFEKTLEHNKALDIYNNFIEKLPKNPVFDYWKIQSEQIILYKNNEKYLLNKKNIKPNSTYSVFRLLDGLYHSDLLLNKLN